MNGFTGRGRIKGITMISFILVLCVIGFLASILMSIWGPYYESRNVYAAIDSVAGETGSSQKEISELQRSLQKRFDVGYVDSVQGKDATIVDDKGGRQLSLSYEVRTHYMANIDIVMTFSHAAPLK